MTRTVSTPTRLAAPALTALLACVGLVALSIGSTDLPLGDVLRVIAGNDESLGPARTILLDIRLPRIILAAMVGAALALSGASMQSLFRNPLADPGLIGISAGAAFAAAAAIVLGGLWLDHIAQGLAAWLPAVAAFAGGLIATVVVYRIAGRGGVMSVSTMLLAGIAINALCGAGTGLMTYLARDQELRTLIFWTLGSLGNSSWTGVGVFLPFFLLGAWLLLRLGRDLNTLLLGELDAAALGVELGRVKRHIVLASAMMVGSAVALSGIIAFVGLVVPHIVRIGIGPDNRVLLPCSALLGGTLLIGADLLARTIVSPGELPIGIVTALLGGPFFLYLLMQRKPRVLV